VLGRVPTGQRWCGSDAGEHAAAVLASLERVGVPLCVVVGCGFIVREHHEAFVIGDSAFVPLAIAIRRYRKLLSFPCPCAHPGPSAATFPPARCSGYACVVDTTRRAPSQSAPCLCHRARWCIIAALDRLCQ